MICMICMICMRKITLLILKTRFVLLNINSLPFLIYYIQIVRYTFFDFDTLWSETKEDIENFEVLAKIPKGAREFEVRTKRLFVAKPTGWNHVLERSNKHTKLERRGISSEKMKKYYNFVEYTCKAPFFCFFSICRKNKSQKTNGKKKA